MRASSFSKSETSPAPPFSLSDPRTDGLVLAVCFALIVLSRLLSLAGDGTVVLGVGAGLRLPGVCAFRALSGLPCPGCGMTRSFVAMGHGDLSAAWRQHRIGPFLYLLVLLQIPYRSLRLVHAGFRRSTDGLDVKLSAGLALALAAALLIAWPLRLYSLG